MAFTRDTLSGNIGVGGGGISTLFTYTSPDTLADVEAVGYFNDASDVLEVNDLIHTVATTFAIYRVSANVAGVVTITAVEKEA